MADEEVDWGMDDTVDVWRQDGAEISMDAGDDDVISLGGMEEESESDPSELLETRSDALSAETNLAATTRASPRRASSSKPVPTGPSKAPPSGPRRSVSRSAAPNGAPLGPRASSEVKKDAEHTPVAAAVPTVQASLLFTRARIRLTMSFFLLSRQPTVRQKRLNPLRHHQRKNLFHWDGQSSSPTRDRWLSTFTKNPTRPHGIARPSR